MTISPTAGPLEARFQLTPADAEAFDAAAKGRSSANAVQRLIRALLALFALLIVATFVFSNMVARNLPHAASEPSFLSMIWPLAAIMLFLVFYFVVLQQRKNARAKLPAFTEQTTIAFDEIGVSQNVGAFSNRIEWRGFHKVIATANLLCLLTSANDGTIVPRRAFTSDDDWQRFVNFARESWQKTQPVVPPIANA